MQGEMQGICRGDVREADLRCMQVVMRSGGGMFGEDDSNHKMGFQECCDALITLTLTLTQP